MAHLYCMTRSDAPGIFKVGRSDDPKTRAAGLQGGHTFYMNVEATFWDKGDREKEVHGQLEMYREAGPGKEWFRTELDVVFAAIARSIAPKRKRDGDDCTNVRDPKLDRDYHTLRARVELAREFVKERCESVARIEATRIVDFKHALSEFLAISPQDLRPILLELGIDPSGANNSAGTRIAFGPHSAQTMRGPLPGLRLVDIPMMED